MKTENFIKLINSITKKDFQIKTSDTELKPEETYYIFRITPERKYKIGFDFKCPKNEENLIKSFINVYCSKYREPDPANYTGWYYGTYNKKSDWNFMSENEKEFCINHHSSHMYSKSALLEQIKENMNDSNIENVLCKYGFYHTVYGIGIFVLFSGQYELNAINRMSGYLKRKNIPFRNEYSNAKWVYRFVINIDKDIHKSLLSDFNKTV